MKKLLLSLMAVFASLSTFAYNIGDYIYTSDAKFKVIGESVVPALTSWNGTEDPDTWSVYTPAEGEEVSVALESLDGSEGSTLLTTNAQLTFGSRYVVTLKIKGVAEGSTSITAGAQNEINAFITNAAPSPDGVLTGTSGTDYWLVSTSQSILNGEWTEISFSLVDTCTESTIGADTHYLNVTIGRLTTGTVIADASVQEVVSVYDTRIMDRKVEYAQTIMADANFSEGADATPVSEVIEMYEGMKEAGEVDDESTMNDLAATLDDALQEFMDTNSDDISSEFQYIDITSMNKYNRGNISHEQVIGGFKFRGDNWLHGQDADELNKQIQQGYGNNAGSVSLYSEKVPAGKYYIAGELMNAYLKSSKATGYVYTYSLLDSIKLYVGSDSTDFQYIVGKDYVKFYYVGTLKEGEVFDAGFWWAGEPSTTNGSSFRVRNIEVRAFGDVTEKIKRANAWATFIAQWNAAKNNRNTLLEKQNNASYPWEQDSLTRTLDEWDPYYNAVLNVWVDDEGNDLGVATNDELTEWAETQGYTYVEGESPSWANRYPLVRAYQYTSTYAQEQNQPFIDLVALVAEAKAAVDDPEYSSVDATDLKAAISESESMIAAVTSTNQNEEFAAQLAALQQALDEFYFAGASFAKQAEVTIINPNFTYKNQNLTGGEETTDASGGWNSYTSNASEYWRIGDGGTDADGEYLFAGKNRAAMWRGWTGNPVGSLTQDVVVTKAGHYTFRCQAYVTGDNAKNISSVRHINIQTEIRKVWDPELEDSVEEEVEISRDTTYFSGIKLVFGSVTNEDVDSIDVWTSGETVGNYAPQWFAMNYDKATDGEETIRFGMDGLKARDYLAAGMYSGDYTPNAYGFGTVSVLYGGPSEKYYEDEKRYIETDVKAITDKNATPVAIYTISGAQVNSYVKGINIVKFSDGTVKKIYVK